MYVIVFQALSWKSGRDLRTGPFAAQADISTANTRKLHEIRKDKETFTHCATGHRAGALLRPAHKIERVPVEDLVVPVCVTDLASDELFGLNAAFFLACSGRM